MRRLWTDIIQPAVLPLFEMQRFGLLVDKEAQTEEIEAAEKEKNERAEAVVQVAMGMLQIPEAPCVDPCVEHPEFRGETRRQKCERCAEIWGEQRLFRTSAAFKKAKRLSDFNPSSDDHLRWLLFERIGLEPIERTERGLPRVNLNSLNELKLRKTTPDEWVPLLDNLVELAHLDTMIGTFLNPPIGKDGRAHPPLTLEGTSIGRVRSGMLKFDADKPGNDLAFNVQNIPERARHIYRADPGHVFLEVDASKIEWILMMLDARSERAEKAYKSGDDVHMLNAQAIATALGKDWATMTKEERGKQRWWAKRCTHGIDYGMSAEKTSRVFRIPLKEARAIRDGYFAAWPEVPKWQAAIEEEAMEKLSLRNCFGRQRRFLDITAVKRGGRVVYKLGELNEALAFRPASTNADIWKIRLREIHDAGFTQVTGTHDSHLLQVREDEVAEAERRVLAICQSPIAELGGLVSADAWSPIYESKVGKNWGPKTEENPEGLEKR